MTYSDDFDDELVADDVIYDSNEWAGLADDQDDLGKPGGSTRFENASAARVGVLRWRVVAVGRRPSDHFTRDLLFASAQRDRRLVRFRLLCKNRPSWMLRDTSELRIEEQEIVIKYRALHFLHLLHLSDIEQQARQHHREVIRRLQGCWPSTVQVAWHGPGRNKTHRDVCRLTRLCPFCCARSVTSLYDRLRQGPCVAGADKLLVLGRLSVSDEQLGQEQVPPAERCRFARHRLGQYIQSFAQAIGVEGGITTFQVGPQLYETPIWTEHERQYQVQAGFAYQVSVLGEVTNKAREFAHFLESGSPPRGFQDVRLGHSLLQPTWSCDSCLRTGALRALLVGTSQSYRNGCVSGTHVGAFSLQPWVLSNYQQWSQHLEATRSMRLFDSWGTWRCAVPSSESSTGQDPGFVNAPARRGRYRRRMAFEQANANRCAEALDRRESLLELARIIHAELQASTGIHPGHRQLREQFAQRGHQVSERDARWLAKAVRDGDTTEG